MIRERGFAFFAASVLLGILLVGCPGTLLAQNNGSISGRVVDAASLRPLSDVQISIPGTGIGTLSNDQGAYLLSNVPPGQVRVQVVILGYGTQEQTVTVAPGQIAHLDFSLGQDAIALDEIVVTGVGKETERRRLSTSLDVISAEEIAQVPVTTVDQLLQGRVAGASINAQSSQPGTASLINFRGVSSVFGAQTPVVYVDGVRVDNDISTAAGTGGEQSSALADLLTSDIERVEVTRGGAASTLFGSDAATGVIQIFTKKGRIGAPRFTARMEMGYDEPELKYMFDTKLVFPDLVEAGDVPANFMEREFWQTGMAQNYYMAVDGGSDQVTYSVGARIQDEEGVQPKNGSTIYSLRGGLRATVSEDFTLNFSGNFTRSSYARLFNGTAIADPLTTFEVGDALYFSGAADLYEAMDIFLMPDIDEVVNRFIFSTGFTWNLSDSWFARVNTGIDYRGNHQRILEPLGFTPGEPTGSLDRYQREFTSFSFDGATTWSWAPADGLSSDLTVGAQGFRDNESVFSGSGVGFALPGAPDIDEAGQLDVSESNTEVFSGGVYVEEQFDIFERLTLNAGMRFDASTAFGDDVSFESYPKAGVSYLASEDDWFGKVGGTWWNEMKMRAAYGATGKPPSPFDKDRSYSATSFRGEAAPTFDNPGNEDLRPERTSTIEIGFDASFLDNRLGLDFTWYDATTTDALFFVPEQPVTGQGTQLRNVGEIRNTGIELGWNAQLLNRSNLAWQFGGTFQTVDNRVTDMGGAAPFFVESQKHVCGPPNDCDEDKPGIEELPVGAWFVTMPFDTNEDGLPDSSKRLYTGGQPTPTMSGSFNTSLRVGTRWTISTMADWAAGHEVMDFGSVWSTFNGIYRRQTIRCGEEPSDNCAYLFPVRYDLNGNVRGKYSQSQARSAFIYDGDWLKWREFSVRYSIPEAWTARVGAGRGTLYTSIRNLFIWSKNEMIDPELNGLSGGGLVLGSESSITASPPRKFRFGLELVF